MYKIFFRGFIHLYSAQTPTHVIILSLTTTNRKTLSSQTYFFIFYCPSLQNRRFYVVLIMRKEQYLKPMQCVLCVYGAAVLSSGRSPALTADPIVHSEKWPYREVPMVSHPSSPTCSRFHIGLTHQHTACFGNSITQGGMQHSAGPGNHHYHRGALWQVTGPRQVFDVPGMSARNHEWLS